MAENEDTAKTVSTKNSDRGLDRAMKEDGFYEVATY